MTEEKQSDRQRLLSAALWYARRGWPVFPCKPNSKEPATEHGYIDATTDADTIRQWWGGIPGANIGIATGAAGLVVVDVDTKNGAQGLESWRDLRHELALDDATPTVETPTGGLHVYYQGNGHPIRNSAGRLGPGLDVRAQGGYVVAPPSRIGDAAYSWAMDFAPTECEPLTIPQALVDALTAKPPSPTPAIEGAIPKGQRNATLASLAGTMRRKGAPEAAILAALRAVPCEEPLSDAELQSIAASIGSYTPAESMDGRPAILRSDATNAELFIRLHGEDLRYCAALGGWLVWDGRRWATDATGQVERWARDVPRALYAEASQYEDKDDRKKIVTHALRSESTGRLKAMLEQAWTVEGVAVTVDAFDGDPWLLNVNNGTVDLRTGALREHRRDDLITKLAPVQYDPDATLPLLDRYLDTATEGDADFLAYLQRALGYTLTGSTDEDAVFLLLGPGGSGKTTLVEAMLATLGDYGAKASFESFLAGQRTAGAARPDVVAMRGARLVAAAEPRPGAKLDSGTVKELSGGDSVSARQLYAAPFTFRPMLKLWLAANDAPAMSDQDSGLWRRLRRIPFEHVIPTAERDPGVKRGLQTPEGRAALLAWAVRGCLGWQREGLGECPAVRRATDTLRASMDPLAVFFETACDFGPDLYVKARTLRGAYTAWAEDVGGAAIGNKDWGDRLRGLGLKSGRETVAGSKVTVWRGIGLKATDPGADDGTDTTEAEKDSTTGLLPETLREAENSSILGQKPPRTVQNGGVVSSADVLDEIERQYLEEAERDLDAELDALPGLF